MKTHNAALVVVVLAAAGHAQSPSPNPSPQAASSPAITKAELLAHVRFLADDLLEGRGPGTRGDQLARTYISTQLQAAGLQPGGADGSWMQPVPILGITSEVTTPLHARGPKGDAKFTAPDDYTAVAGSPDATAAWNGAELVFVGYGIHAPEQQWDDFGDVDLRGKVLLVMNDDPSFDPARFAGKARLYYGRWSYKFEEAARRGALGAIVIHTTPSAGYPFQVIQANHGRENFWLPFAEGEPTLGIRSWVSEDAARQLCALGGHDLTALCASSERAPQRPVPLGVTLDLAIANTVRELPSGNVVGVLPGSDPTLRDQHVVRHRALGPPRHRQAARRRRDLQRCRRQRVGLRRPAGAGARRRRWPSAAPNAAVRRGDRRGVRPARVDVVRPQPDGASREPDRELQRRRAQRLGPDARPRVHRPRQEQPDGTRQRDRAAPAAAASSPTAIPTSGCSIAATTSTSRASACRPPTSRRARTSSTAPRIASA
jgi:hypothetical protein